MSSFFDKLNLTPQERRVVVLVVTVLLVVVNAVLVWPHFQDWPKLRADLDKSAKTRGDYEAEIARTPDYQTKLSKLEGQGSAVLPADQAIQLTRTVQNQALQSGVLITQTRVSGPTGVSTNTFFDEQTLSVTVSTGEKELVDFLYALGTGGSMIRVRDMDLHPDAQQYRLNGNITLVASYQKRAKAPAPEPGKPAATTPANAKGKKT